MTWYARAPREVRALIAVGISLAAIAVVPVSTATTRRLAVLFGVVLVGLSVVALRRRRGLCFAMVCVVAGAVVFGFAPGRPYSTEGLRAATVAALRSYEGTLYFWGGENRFGIDCSGLVRRALIDASLREGLTTANPALVRDGLALWWNDSTARQLGEGYLGLTTSVGEGRSINSLDPSMLEPGDLAVTASGVHVLGYAGDSTWVEADPTFLRVMVVRVPEPTNPWFETPVRIVRWRALESSAAR